MLSLCVIHRNNTEPVPSIRFGFVKERGKELNVFILFVGEKETSIDQLHPHLLQGVSFVFGNGNREFVSIGFENTCVTMVASSALIIDPHFAIRYLSETAGGMLERVGWISFSVSFYLDTNLSMPQINTAGIAVSVALLPPKTDNNFVFVE